MDFLCLSVLLLVVSRLYLVKACSQSGLYSDGDISVHLGFIKEYFRNGGKPIRYGWRYTLEYDDYPSGYHKLFYWMGLRCDELARYGGLFNILFDVCHLVLIYVLLCYHDANPAWILLYPISRFLISHDGRATTFNERSFGVFFGSLYLVSTYLFVQSGEFEFLSAAFFSFFVFSVSSKFAWQAVSFITIYMALYFKSIAPITVYALSFLFAWVLSSGYSVAVLRGLIRHSTFYATYLASRHYGLEKNFEKIYSVRSFKAFVFELLDNRIFRFITDYPVMFFSLLVVASAENFLIGQGLIPFLIVLHLFFCTERFKFLGEAERYIEFSLPFLFLFLSANYPPPNLIYLAPMLVFYLLLFYRQCTRIVVNSRNSVRRDDEYKAVLHYMSQFNEGLVVTIPFRLAYVAGLNLSSDNHLRFLMNYTNAPTGAQLETLKDLMPDHYPFISKDTDSIIQKYEVDFLLVDKQAVAFLHSKVGGYYQRFNKYPIVFETATLMVVDLRGWVQKST